MDEGHGRLPDTRGDPHGDEQGARAAAKAAMNGSATPLLIALYVACELIANVTAGRTVEVWGFAAPGGVFVYALTFTLIDLLNERMGKSGARQVVAAAFAANLLLGLYTTLVLT
ncbi:hypothetical protein EG829_30790, partial [bacterium]|nr:hypothetical protein [bacterium]